eukprot:gene33737-41621_t
MKRFLLTALFCLQALAAHAAIDPALLQPLAGDDPDARIEAVGKIAALADADALKLLQALNGDTLYATPDGAILVVDGDKAWNPATGATGAVPDGVDGVVVNNRLRGAVEGALSGMALLSPQREQRLAAARQLQAKSADPAQAPLVRKAYALEQDPEIKAILQTLVATADLQSPDAAVRVSIVNSVARADQRVPGQPHQAQAAGALCHVQAQHTPVDAAARADIQSLHQVLVVAYENEGGAPRVLFAVHAQPHIQEGIAPQRRQRRPGERQPLAASEPALLLFTVAHNVRVQAEAGIVEKDAAVHFAHVDPHMAAGGQVGVVAQDDATAFF